MISISTNPVARYLLTGLVSILLLCVQQAQAKSLQWNNEVYTHYSDQEPLKSLLEAVAASQKTPIIMSEKIDTVISAYYKKQTPRSIFLEVIKTNGLVWYYDGDTLFVEREDEMQTGSVSLSNVSASQFTSSLERLGILDHRYQWITSDVDRMVYFKGPEPFVTAVLEMSKVLDKKSSSNSVYRWTDEQGRINFGSSLPQKYREMKEITVRRDDEKSMVVEQNVVVE